MAQHGYLAVAMSHWHVFVKTGMGSVWGLGFFLVVVGAIVIDMSGDVGNGSERVSDGRIADVVIGSSGSSSGSALVESSCGRGNANASAIKALIARVVRIILVVEVSLC